MLTVAFATLSFVLSAHAAVQQPEPTSPPPPAPTTAKPVTPSVVLPAVPTLDDLLGVKPDKPGPASAPGVDLSKPGDIVTNAPARPSETGDPNRADLDRLLSGEEMGEAFSQAIALMGDAAKRLDTAKDTGIDTQRVQEDVIRRLDQLLSSLQQQQSSSSSSSSSSSQSQQDKQQGKNQPSQKKPGGKQGQQSQPGDGNKESESPPKQEGALRPGLDSARAAWGALPARVRDMLLQGSDDPFSSRYKALTEAYYRRLAEERK